MTDLEQHFCDLAAPHFPGHADIEAETRLSVLSIRVSWKLNNPPNRPIKWSKNVVIRVTAIALVPRLSEFERLCEKLNCVSGEWAVSREVRGVELSVRHLAAAE